MATPKKPPEEHKRRGRPPRSQSPAIPTAVSLTEEERAWLIDRYGGVSAGVVELIRQARAK